MQQNKTANERIVPGHRTGKAPVKGDARLLHLKNYADLTKKPPERTNFWKNRKPFDPRSFGNVEFGDCTRAKQAWAVMRMQRIEGRNTPVIDDQEVIDQYLKMTEELYGGGDTGAFEMDALSYWRKKDRAIRDTKGHAYTIDAFSRVNQFDLVEFKNSLALAEAHGLAVCFNLPWAWAPQPNQDWDVPENQQPIGIFQPGSWGGHSMWAIDYDPFGVVLDSTWMYKPNRISWKAFTTYCDECYFVVDSVNDWKKKKNGKLIDLDGMKKEVNRVSSTKIAA